MNYYNEIKETLVKNEVYKKVKDYSKNKSDLNTYFEVGKLIVEAQGGEERAKYGNKLIKEYSEKLTKELGSGYKDDVMTYNKQAVAYTDQGSVTQPTKLIADGSCYEIRINSSQLGFTFDINGAEKGPNALGHDIFSFWMDDNDYLQPIKQSNIYSENDVETGIENCLTSGEDIYTCTAIWHQRGFPCTMNSTQQGNGLGCSWFALHDECPDDDTKGYWECLP